MIDLFFTDILKPKKRGNKMRLLFFFEKRMISWTILSIAIIALTGCETPSTNDCNTPMKAGEDIKCSQGDRTFYLYASQNYNPSEPTALIVDAHGAMETAEQQAGIDSDYCAGDICLGGKGSGWRLEADMPGNSFIVMNPQGRNNAWAPADVNFILAAVEHTKSIANIDKVFMSGVSNGGLLSYWTGCPNSDIFSGLAPIVGGAACRQIDNPLPVISFDAEPDFAYATTVNASNKMVELNNCKSGPSLYLTIDSSYDEPVCRDDIYSTDPKLVPCSSITPAIEPTICKKWTDCDGGVEVVFCEVAPATNHPENPTLEAHLLVANASHLNIPSLAWRFFKEHGYPSGDEEENGDTPYFPGCR